MIARHLEIARVLYPTLPLPLDRMAYRKEFEPIHQRFCELAGIELDRSDVWHALMSVRKRGQAPSQGAVLLVLETGAEFFADPHGNADERRFRLNPIARWESGIVSIRLRVWGDFACFTRPEQHVERESYPVLTPSGARGVIEAVYWKPEIRWTITRIRVLNPIRFTSIRRNEVGKKIPQASVAAAMKAGRGQLGLFIEEERQQRAATVLRDVDYVVEARFDVIGGENNVGKHLDQFNRRAREGRCFQRPYLGCREFPADFALIEPDEPLPPVHAELRGERDLGLLLHDIDFEREMTPRFFRAILHDGILDVPPFPRGEVPR